MAFTKKVENSNDSLAFKQFTNNRFKVEKLEGETIYRMTPGLTGAEAIGMIIPIGSDETGRGFSMIYSGSNIPSSELPEGYNRDDIYVCIFMDPSSKTPFGMLSYCGETGKAKVIASTIPSAEELAEITAKG